MTRFTIVTILLCVSFTICKSNSINNKKENLPENELIKVDNSEIDEKTIPIDTLRINFPKIGELLDSITLSIESHDWNTFIQYCDKDNYEEQNSNGLDKEQYIFEILNLNTKNDADYLNEIHKVLDQLETMKIIKYSNDEGYQEFFFQFKGIITTKEKTEYNFWFELRIDENDAKIVGNVG